jgi:PAS domain S-box-containing protein
MLCGFIAHWREPLSRCEDFCVKGYESGLESGSFSYGSYCAGLHTAFMTFKGDPLSGLQEQCGRYLETLKKAGSEDMVLAITGVQRMALTLAGSTKAPPDFSDESFDEPAYVGRLREGKRFFLLCLYYTFKLPVLYLFGAYQQADEMTDDLEGKANFLFALFHSAYCNFYQSLTAAARYPGCDPGERKKYARVLKRNQKQMKRWLHNCPANFRNKYLLVSAEVARLKGRTEEAGELFDASIRAARDQHFSHEEGLANELAARFHLARDRRLIARAYLLEAIDCYRRWGASAKIRHLELQYERLLGPSTGRTLISNASTSGSTGASVPGSSALDLATVLKTSQAISGEISLDRLLRELIKIVIETAGARRGVLLLQRDGGLCLEAEGADGNDSFSGLPSLPLEGSNRVAESVVLYVARTLEPVVLNDAEGEGMFTHDPYIRMQRSRSILCLPIINKRVMTGILYLENDLASHSFTESRVALLEALSAQIAISLENARLYEEAIGIKESLRESEQKFRMLAETMKAGIVIYRENAFLYVNPETEAITGYSRDEFLSMSFDSIIHPEHLDMVRNRAADRLAGRPAPAQYEFKIVRKDGRERWLMSTAGRIVYGRDHAMITALVDITSQKEADEERLRLYEENVRHYRERIEEERRHQREKENILMDIHDGIGGITTNIGLLAEVAQKTPASEDVKKRLSTISQLARDGSAEIRTLMFSLDNRDHTWQALVAELRSHGAKTFGPHGVAFEMSIDIEETAPRPGSLLFLHLFRIYREALMNVVKHAQATAVAATLRVDRDRLLLIVCDDGQGCNPGSISGKGRGLNNMKVRAAALGGSITITSAQGTCVSLEIPRTQLPLG